MPEWVADKQQRLARIREAKEALEAQAREKGGPGKFKLRWQDRRRPARLARWQSSSDAGGKRVPVWEAR